MNRPSFPFSLCLLLLLAGGAGLATTSGRHGPPLASSTSAWGEFFIKKGGYWAARPADYRKELKRHHYGGPKSPTWDPTACNHFAWKVLNAYDREFEQGNVHRQWQYVVSHPGEWQHGTIKKDSSNLRVGDVIFTANLGHIGLFELKSHPKPTISASLGGRLPQWRGWWPNYRFYSRAIGRGPGPSAAGELETPGKAVEGSGATKPARPGARTAPAASSSSGSGRRSAGPHNRPLVLFYVGDSGKVRRQLISATVDVGARQLGNAPVADLLFARWQPAGPYLAVDLDAGIQVCRYSPETRRFGTVHSLPRAFGRGRSYQLPFTYSGLAWSPDGQSLLVDYGKKGVERIDLRSGTRRVLVTEKLLGRDPFSITRGLDWSPDAKRIAFSALGQDAAFPGMFDPNDQVFKDRARHCDVWLAAADGRYARRIGHGSRPRFSPDGKTLLALDRYDDRFDTCIRRYDLTAKQPEGRVIIDNARAFCWGRGPNEIAVVLTSGELVLADLNGRITSRVLAVKDIVPPEMQGKLDQLRGALVDW